LYREAKFDEAKFFYQQALNLSPDSRDALLGLAAIELKFGKPENAIAHYRSILSRAPKDSYALSGLLSLSNYRENIPKIESEVVSLLRDFPDDPHLHFLLGNLYSEQTNWRGAQSAYQSASSLDKNNPDYLFNLAVSLDRLGETKNALHTYQQAQTLSQFVAPSFSLRSLRERIATLQQFIESAEQGN
jgi:tetratricopeptide (TPR) repeat protein